MTDVDILSDKVIVRQFEPSDQERCIELFRLGLCSYTKPPMDKLQPWFVDLKLKEDMGNIQQHYIEKDNANFWVAVLNGVVVGCVGAMPDIHVHGDSDASLELIRMSVDPSIRRKGVGSLLIKQVENYAKANGFFKVSISTLVWMTPACSLYERNGYVRKKIKKFPTPIGVEAHIQAFCKDLS